MDYLSNPSIQERLKNAPSFQKKAETLLRRPSSSEVGQNLTTFVKDEASIRQESVNTITGSSVIARNAGAIGQNEQGDIYNEWVIEEDVVAKNYGTSVLNQLTENFRPFRKASTIQCIQLTSEVLQELGVKGDTLAIDVSWSDEPMIAQKGDFLTSGGYSVSAHDMASTYVQQEDTNAVAPPLSPQSTASFVAKNRTQDSKSVSSFPKTVI